MNAGDIIGLCFLCIFIGIYVFLLLGFIVNDLLCDKWDKKKEQKRKLIQEYLEQKLIENKRKEEKIDMKSKGIEVFCNGEFAFSIDALKKGQGITIFRPDVNAKITLTYMSKEDYAKIERMDK